MDAAPSWFHEQVGLLKLAGFLGNVELSDDDLAAQWDRHEGARPGIVVRMLVRHRSRSCELPRVEPHPMGSTRRHFDLLQDITMGRLILRDVVERWDGATLRHIELTTARGRWRLLPKLTGEHGGGFGVLDTWHLLGALNAIATDSRFSLLGEHVMFVDDSESDALARVGITLLEFPPIADAVQLVDASATPSQPAPPRERAEVAPVIRKAYRPVFGTGDEQVCKLGGAPWLPNASRKLTIPRCKQCGGEMALLFQAALQDLPIGFERRGLLQVFVCQSKSADSCLLEESGVAVIVHDKAAAHPPQATSAPARTLHPIVGWTAFDDEPGLGDSDDEDADADDADDGLKCGGWPHWIQGKDDACPRCRKPCKLALQVPEHDGLYFGDSGLIYVLVCDSPRCRRWAGGVIQYY